MSFAGPWSLLIAWDIEISASKVRIKRDGKFNEHFSMSLPCNFIFKLICFIWNQRPVSGNDYHHCDSNVFRNGIVERHFRNEVCQNTTISVYIVNHCGRFIRQDHFAVMLVSKSETLSLNFAGKVSTVKDVMEFKIYLKGYTSKSQSDQRWPIRLVSWATRWLDGLHNSYRTLFTTIEWHCKEWPSRSTNQFLRLSHISNSSPTNHI